MTDSFSRGPKARSPDGLFHSLSDPQLEADAQIVDRELDALFAAKLFLEAARSVCRGRPKEDPEELAQNLCFQFVQRGAAAFRGLDDAARRGLAWKMAANMAVDRRRKRVRRMAVSLQDIDEHDLPRTSDESIADFADRQACGALLAEAIAQLSHRDRVILKRHVRDGETHQVIADRLGCKRQAVTARWARILKTLRCRLREAI